MTSRVLRWGVVGPGRIARTFAEDITGVDSARLVAVASTQRQRAEDFAERYGLDRAHDIDAKSGTEFVTEMDRAAEQLRREYSSEAMYQQYAEVYREYH